MQINTPPSKIIKSFARKKYKQITSNRLLLLEKYQHKIFSTENLNHIPKMKKISFEIGFGNGEHLIHQMIQNPHKVFLGCEVFINGILNFLSLVEKFSLNNYFLFKDDVNIMISQLPNRIIEEVFIFFPDPWPKTRQKKKRLVNNHFLIKLLSKLKLSSNLYFVSDNEDYTNDVFQLLNNNKNIQVKMCTSSNSGFVKLFHTKYYKKALDRGSKIYYIEANNKENISET